MGNEDEPAKEETVEEMLARLKLKRFKVLCNCGCGKQTASLDIPAAMPDEEVAKKLEIANAGYTHGDCAKKMREREGI